VRVKTPAMIMGTGAATNGVITVNPRKWLYVSMLHPETTEESVIKLISTAMKSTATDFNCVKFLPRNMKDPTFISFKIGMPEDLLEGSLNPTLWPSGVAIREFIDRPRNFFRSNVVRIPV
jgi:hypothetical protein